ncbi:MAG: long-chain fatty acid--CoA ligase [Balneolales bacterium]|nr:long-chain fatty acid--CoA ligase [Balneolales bacterium]
MKYEPAVVPKLIEVGLSKNTSGIVSAVKRNGQWIETSVSEFRQKVRNLALGLYELGVRKGDRVSIHSENSTEWLICDQAILSIGAVNVAIYTTQPADQITYILENSEAKVHIVSNDSMFQETKPLIKSIKTVKAIISIQPSRHQKLKSLESVIQMGIELDKDKPELFDELCDAIEPDDLANINYTSGTTGVPKGVMLTHLNLASNTLATAPRVPFQDIEPPKRKILSYLPLTHMLERIASYTYVFEGASVYYIEDIQDIRTDLITIKPVYFATVPRLLEKIMTGVKVKGQDFTGMKKRLYYWAVHFAENYNPENPPKGLDKVRWNIADKLVYSKIRDGMGGNLIGMVAGGAALAPNVMRFFNGVGFHCAMGYGLTETSPVMTTSLIEQIRIGSAGKPLEDVEIRIAEDGEIETRGPNIMKGYYKMPDKTAEVMTKDGWFKTGDIGYLDDEGWLFITDRKKSLFKLSTGKYVAPQPIENELMNSGFIDQALVIGNQEKFCAAIIVPDWTNLKKRFENKGHKFPAENPTENEFVIHRIQKEVDKVNMRLPNWEKVKKFILVEEAFTIEKGELTPKMSIRRSVVKEHYKDEIHGLYH